MNIIRELRKRAGIQQKELSIVIGVSQPTVSDWEANKKDPSGDRLKKLARFFNVDELTILGKGVYDLSEEQKLIPKTDEARIISAGIDKLPLADRKRALEMFNLMFERNEQYFTERKSDDHDTEL